MKCKLLGVFWISGYKMCVELGPACAFASWLLGRSSEEEQMLMSLWSHHSVGWHAHMCDLLLSCLKFTCCALF